MKANIIFFKDDMYLDLFDVKCIFKTKENRQERFGFSYLIFLVLLVP